MARDLFRGFPTDRQGALERLQAFVPRAGNDYALNRNFDEGPGSRLHVSQLSPMLQNRLISEAEVLEQVLAVQGLADAEKFCQEILWRGYWRSWLELRPQVWGAYQTQLAESQREREQHALYQAVIAAKAPIECMNIWVHELKETGYLHNHARMWFASLWIFSLRLPWSWGAQFFLDHLLDGDAASNTLSWRWVAGLHTKDKAYLATAKNIEKFSRLKPDGKGFASEAIVEEEELDLSSKALAPATPFVLPYHEAERALLLLLGDDLSPQAIPGLMSSPWSAIACLDPKHFTRGAADTVQSYRKSCFSSAFEMWQAIAKSPIHLVSDCQSIRQLCDAAKVRTIAVLWPHQGPYLDQLPQILPKELPFIAIQKHYDVALKNLAKRGFFDFWKHCYPLLQTATLMTETSVYQLTPCAGAPSTNS